MGNRDKLKELIHEINLQYSNWMYQSVSDDKFLDNVPQKRQELWYSNGNHELAVCNLDALYKRGQAGEEEIESAYENSFKRRFAHEFEHIDKANITKE